MGPSASFGHASTISRSRRPPAARHRSAPPATRTPRCPSSPRRLLADGPVELDNIPRIRDVETMLALLADLGAAVEWTGAEPGPGRCRARPAASRSTPSSAPGSGPRSSWPVRCSPASARCTLPPPGGDVIGRRRVDTHFLALEQLGASRHRRRPLRDRGQEAGRRRHLPRRAERHRHRERADGRGAWPRAGPCSATPPASRTSRTSPALLVAMGAHIEGIGTNVYTHRGRPPAGAAPPTPSAPITSRSAASSAWPRSPTARSRSIRCGATTSAAPCSASTGWASGPGIDGTSAASSTPTRSAGSAPTSAATSPSSRTVPGRPFRPT